MLTFPSLFVCFMTFEKKQWPSHLAPKVADTANAPEESLIQQPHAQETNDEQPQDAIALQNRPEETVIQQPLAVDASEEAKNNYWHSRLAPKVVRVVISFNQDASLAEITCEHARDLAFYWNQENRTTYDSMC